MRRRTFLTALGALPLIRTASAAPAFQDVVVIGGGPAGVSAALELAERGLNVTLVEAGSALGGKVSGWDDLLHGEKIDVEHGVHGWWHQYVHFRDLLSRFGLEGALLEHDPKQVGLWQPGAALAFTLPERLRALMKRSAAKGYKNFPINYQKGLSWLRKQRPSALRLELGGQSIVDHARNAKLTLFSVFDDTFAHSMYFRPPDQVDAAEYIEGERFYFFGTKKNARVQWLRGNPDTLIWTPLANALQGLGGTLLLGERVQSLVQSGGRVVGVRLGQPEVSIEVEGPFDAWKTIDLGGEVAWIGPGKEGPVAFSARCTHLGCRVVADETGFVCPCHGGRYNAQGAPTAGPPEHPLQRLRVEPIKRSEKLRVTRPGRQHTIGARWVVLAVDVPAAQQLAGDLLPKLKQLAACREVVARFWFDTDVREDTRPALVLDGFEHGSNAFLIHRLQDSARSWVEARGGGSVVEIQAFRGWKDGQDLLAGCLAEVKRAWPELEHAKLLKHHLTVGERFTWFQPGWRSHAPQVRCGVPGLLIAGDFVHVPDREEQFMERAVMTGRMAANVALLDLNKQAAPILQPHA